MGGSNPLGQACFKNRGAPYTGRSYGRIWPAAAVFTFPFALKTDINIYFFIFYIHDKKYGIKTIPSVRFLKGVQTHAPLFFYLIRHYIASILRLFCFVSFFRCLQRRNMCYTKANGHQIEKIIGSFFSPRVCRRQMLPQKGRGIVG